MTRRTAAAVVLAYLALAAGAAWLAAGLRSDTSPHVFLRRDDPVREAHDRLRAAFGDDSFVLVTCRGETAALAARVPELAERLRACPGVLAVDVPRPGTPLARALRLADDDGSRVSLVADLAGPEGVAQVEAALAAAPGPAPALAGPPVLDRALKRASDRVGRRLFPLLALAMAALIALAYRSLRVMAAVGATTIVALLLGVAFLAACDEPINLLTILLPVLLLALTVALCVHLVNSYRLHLGGGADVDRAVRAMGREELRPCLTTSLTTAAGFGSFAFSRIEPLRMLGLAMAVSILAAFAVAYTLLPALLLLLRPRPREGLAIGARLVQWVPRVLARPRLVYLGVALLVAGAVLAIPHVPQETNGLHYLPPGDALRQETKRLEAEGVGTSAIEVVFRAPPGRPATDLLPVLRRLERDAAAWPAPARGLLTALGLAREGAARLGLDPARAETLALAPLPGEAGRRLRAFRDPAGAARASLRIDTIGVEEYEVLRGRLEETAQAAAALVPGTTFEITGEFPIVMTVQEELLHTLLVSLAGTALTITLILAIALRSLRLALLTLAPAVVPLAAVVCACALVGVPLSIATVMVLSVTLGIVTDDSVHLLHALRSGLDLRHTLARVGTAVTETSIAIFLGFLVVGGADFVPTREFGLLTAGAMLAALVADLVLFPILVRPHAARVPALLPCAQPSEP